MSASVSEMQSYANGVAGQYGIPSDIFSKVIATESSWNPNARSGAGAIGLGQLMPGTAANLGVDPTNWQQNLNGSAQYLSQLYSKFGDWTSAVAAYNAGPGRISSVLAGNSSLPTETSNYLNKIFGDGTTLGSGSAADQQGGTVVSLNPFDWLQAIANFFSFNTGTRLLAIVLGLIFVIAAVFVLVSGNKTVQQVVTKAAAVAA